MAKKQLVKHKENPFLNGLTVTSKGKRVTINTLGGDRDQVLVDQHSGEVKGTHVSTYKQVDDAEFVKLFTKNIALTFDLNPTGRKVFDMLMHEVQHQAITRDSVYIDDNTREEFTKEHNVKLALSTMYRGIDNLIEKQIIARSARTNIYFINPALIFNGDRLAFTQVIERKRKSDEQTNDQKGDAHLQQPMPFDED